MKGLIFTFVLTYGGAAVSLVRPYVGLLVFVCFAILRPESLWHWSGPAGNYSRTVAIALLVGWLVNGAGGWAFGRARGVVLCLVGLWAWMAVGAFPSSEQAAAWERIESMSKTFLPFLVGLTLIDTVAKVKQLAWVIVLSQGYVALELNQMYLAGTYHPVDLDFGSLDNNGLAITMVACAGFAFFLGMDAKKWWQKATAFAAALLMGHFVLFSMSRGGVLSLIFTGVAGFLLMPKTWKYNLVMAVAVLLMLRLAGPPVLERLETAFAEEGKRDRSAQSRLEYWQAAWEATTDHPVVGMGPDQWRFRCPEYGIPAGRAVHSTWLQVSAEHGLVGLLCLGLFYGLCILRLWPLARAKGPLPDPDIAPLARMVIVSVVGFVISSQFVTMHGVDAPYFIALVGAGLLKVHSAPALADPEPPAGLTPGVDEQVHSYVHLTQGTLQN